MAIDLSKLVLLQVEVLRERLRSSEEASTRQMEEHGRELARVLEEKDKAKRDLARLKQHLLDKVGLTCIFTSRC
jgi:hypothetical protein